MSEIKKTISSIFMVPTLKIGRERLRINGFINGYFKDVKQEVPYEDSCYVLFKPNRTESFNQFLNEEYARTKSLIDDYDVEEGFVVLVYSLNPRYKDDFNLIRQGRYSETSQEFQDLFDKVTKVVKGSSVKEETTLQWRIFNKEEDLKEYWEHSDRIGTRFTEDMELWPIWEDKKETLDIEKIKELI